MTAVDTFGARARLGSGASAPDFYALDALKSRFDLDRLPFSIKILLENLLRFEDGETVTAADIERVAAWDPGAPPSHEIAFRPSRVLLQDFTGVPAVVDLAAMRDAVAESGGDPSAIEPLQSVELVIDHSVQVDFFGTSDAFSRNTQLEYERNRERYSFLRWGQGAFDNFSVVPPETGIVHQVNVEYLARVVFAEPTADAVVAFPDTVVGTDSHTTMVNGLGVLGWGVGGIEAEAAMLGQPVSMLVPQVVGFRLVGALGTGVTATDLVLTVTEVLRAQGVVGRFVEFFGSGLDRLPVADRATLGNMSPEFGSTCAMFPIDRETIKYLRLTGRRAEHIEIVERYARAQGLWREPDTDGSEYSEVIELNLGDVEPSISGPKRPQDRIPLRSAGSAFRAALGELAAHRSDDDETDVERFFGNGGHVVPDDVEGEGMDAHTDPDSDSAATRDGIVAIAAVTSCTNTSNPSVMIAAGLLARKARARGLSAKPWVKTSLAPGSKVVTDYLERAGLLDDLAALGFDLVGYGCTTCIGNAGPLPESVSTAIEERELVACSVLSGNRNFEGRIHSLVRANYLASPPLVVAYAIAGRMDIDPVGDALGRGLDGRDVFLRDIWPSHDEVAEVVRTCVDSEMFRNRYADVYSGDAHWRALPVPQEARYRWDPASTYIKRPPFFEGVAQPEPVQSMVGMRALAVLGDSVTTDHISPAGAIGSSTPAGRYLRELGVEPRDFNSYGSRRGNHEVMVRGTFANVRLRNGLAPGTEGGVTLHLPDGEEMSIFDAAARYRKDGVGLVVLAGREYGSGSSRDWAAKGTRLLGVRAVIAQSYERIHRSNLVGMGVLPLQFKEGQSVRTLGLTGREIFDISGVDTDTPSASAVVRASRESGEVVEFEVDVRVDTPQEFEYYRNGGILRYVLRRIALKNP